MTLYFVLGRTLEHAFLHTIATRVKLAYGKPIRLMQASDYCCKTVEVDDLISQLTRGQPDIYISSI
jgi:hypothetical protein